MDIELEIEGVPDGPIADAIRARVKNLRHEIERPGDWRVTIAPSETRGEWDLGIRTPSGWQLASFAEPVERLPDVVERELRERLGSIAWGG
ncbi:MAG: hypothetical protein ABI868_23490 [Acidobacteriota bacterium]